MTTEPQTPKQKTIWSSINEALDTPLGKALLIPAITAIMAAGLLRLSLPGEVEKAIALAKVKLHGDVEAEYCDTLKKGIELIGKQETHVSRETAALAYPYPDTAIDKEFSALNAEGLGFAATLRPVEQQLFTNLASSFFGYAYEMRHSPMKSGAELTQTNLMHKTWRDQQAAFKARRLELCSSN